MQQIKEKNQYFMGKIFNNSANFTQFIARFRFVSKNKFGHTVY